MLIDAGVKDTLDGGFKDTRDGGFEPGGSVCWGHDTGVVEDNIRDFFNNWSGDASIVGIEDDERILFDSGEYEESETWYIGAGRVRLLTNKYISDSMYKLKFDAQTGSFTPGNTITGATSGATATIVAVYQSGGIGYLYLSNISGTFQDDEIIYVASYGAELITNGDMELDANWNNWNTPTLNERSVEQAHGGTYSRKFTGNSQYDGIMSDTIILTVGNLYISTFWLYGDATNEVNARIVGIASQSFPGMSDGGNYIPPTEWTQHTLVFQCDAVGNTFKCGLDKGETAGTHYVDDVSLKQITNAALANGTAVLNSFGSPVVKYKQGASQTLCEADSWHAYTIPFVCGGWVKIRLECT